VGFLTFFNDCATIKENTEYGMEKKMLIPYLIICGIMSVFAFALFGIDKARAADAEARIPELVLLTAAALGGGAGALLGRVLFRHKTNARRKLHFAIAVPVCFVLQAGLLIDMMIG
jgi:uncharacterized membrane protein YsdA (DUF1294 family)